MQIIDLPDLLLHCLVFIYERMSDMKERLQDRVTEILVQRKENRRKLRLRSVLALSVSFVVLYGLLLPAFTLEKPVFCGYEAHVHTDDCYEYYLACPVTGEKQGPLTVEELQQLIASGIRLSVIPVAGAESASEDGLYRPVQGSHVHTGQGGSSDDQGYATSGGNHSGTGDLVVSEAEHPEKSQMPAATDGEGVT